MPNPTLDAEFSEAHDRYFEAANALVPLLVRVALSRLGEVLPGLTNWRLRVASPRTGSERFVSSGYSTSTALSSSTSASVTQTGESRMRSTMSIVSTSTSCSI